MPADTRNWIDIALWIWFSLTALSVIYVAWDLITRTPEMKVMKWAWILVTLYTGAVALVLYTLSCREPTRIAHEKFIAPLWKQTIGSTIHCIAGDATGIIVATAVTVMLGLPMGVDAVVEYIAGFAFGLMIFQALFMREMLGGSYWHALKATALPEWLSMNAMMAGMIPIMIVLMTKDMRAMKPTSLRFWGVMSLATLLGAALAYPANWWLVKHQLKHGMETARALGKGGTKVPAGTPASGHESNMAGMKNDSVSGTSKLLVAIITLAMLAGGVILAAHYGDLSMRASG